MKGMAISPTSDPMPYQRARAQPEPDTLRITRIDSGDASRMTDIESTIGLQAQ